MPVVVAKPQSRASESIVEMAYALSGVRQSKNPKSKEPQKGSGLFGRILGNVNEQAEARVE
jgi:MinD-like ATPase involved in chromosome partitioning or flagellar assembly